jgi:hypothetical protein
MIRRIAAIAVGIASIVASVTLATGPAQSFDPGLNAKVYKLKTIWGGGYTMNVGESAGTTVNGARVQIYHNTTWDNPNRWTFDNQWDEFGVSWYTIRNKWSQQCLTAEADFTVTQRPCDVNDNRQYWSRAPNPIRPDGNFSSTIHNLDYRYRSVHRVLTQAGPWTGTRLWMDPMEYKITQYWRLIPCPNTPDC